MVLEIDLRGQKPLIRERKFPTYKFDFIIIFSLLGIFSNILLFNPQTNLGCKHITVTVFQEWHQGGYEQLVQGQREVNVCSLGRNLFGSLSGSLMGFGVDHLL